jgi:hypothetical protein
MDQPKERAKLAPRKFWNCALLAGAMFWLQTAASAQDSSAVCSPALAQHIPARTAAAPGGHEFVQRVREISGAERDLAISEELLAGNLPGFLTKLKPVTLHGQLSGGESVSITLCVAPDYLAVGSDYDFVRVPMGLGPALAVARRFGFVLPTTRMVDAIYQQAQAQLVPQPMPAGPQMRSTDYFWQHNQAIRAQRQALHAPLGALTAGDKKDLVITNRLWRNPERVAIYGWQIRDGRPIQPLSTVHGARYADYSHGVRLVSEVAYVNGVARSIYDILMDPRLAAVLSNEGAIRAADLEAAVDRSAVATVAALAPDAPDHL